MREGSVSGITVVYPDEVVAAFARNPITITGFSGTYVEMVVSGGSREITERRSPFGEDCFFDLSYYLQVLFDQGSIGVVDYTSAKVNGLSMPGSVVLKFYNDTALLGTLSFSLSALWASAINYLNESVTMFTGYPFTVGVYSDGTYTGVMGSNTYTFGSNAMYNVPVTASGSLVVSDASGAVKTIEVKEQCGNGVYLRWVDAYGVYRYWLFRKGEVNNSIKADGEFVRKNMGTDFGKRRTYKALSSEVELCAPLVDGDTFAFLLGCAVSPVVDMYDNGEWVAVEVSDGDIARERAELQDFVMSIVLPDTIVQKL